MKLANSQPSNLSSTDEKLIVKDESAKKTNEDVEMQDVKPSTFDAPKDSIHISSIPDAAPPLSSLPPPSQQSSTLPPSGLSSNISGSIPAKIDPKDIPPPKHIERKPPAELPVKKLIQTHAIVIPSYASWFSLNHIHEVEKRSLPEFFNKRNRSKTPEYYMKYRNFMVNTYRLAPAEYLTVTACRRHLVGDAAAIMRIHSFLDKWGLINYQVDVEQRPQNVAPPFTGHWKVLHDTPRGLFPFQFYEGVEDPSVNKLPGGKSIDDVKALAAQRGSLNANGVSEHSITSTTTTTTTTVQETKVTTKTAASSPENDVSHSDSLQPIWTPQELLKLLEGVEKFSNDWSKIASHVGSKTKEQAITKFLSLSIEDPYLELNSSNNASEEGRGSAASSALSNGKRSSVDTDSSDRPETKRSKTTDYQSSSDYNWADKLGPLKYGLQNIPLAQAENPVLSVVTFLAGLVDPEVVAAAAGRSVAQIKKQIQREIDESSKSGSSTKEIESKSDESNGNNENQLSNDSKKPSNDSTGDSSMPDVSNNESQANEDNESELNGQASTSKSQEIHNKYPLPFEDAMNIAFGSIAARSSILCTETERKLHMDLFKLLSQQGAKMNIKINQVNKLEREMETERRELDYEREELFLDRLALTRKIDKVKDLLTKSIQFVESGNTTMMKSMIDDAYKVVQDGTKLAFQNNGNSTEKSAVNNGSLLEAEDLSKATSTPKTVEPVSVEIPQTYKYWTM